MGVAAVIVFVGGFALAGLALAGGIGDGLAGAGTLLVGTGAVITALRTDRKVRRVEGGVAVVQGDAAVAANRATAAATDAAEAKALSAETVLSVGPANGETLRELLAELRTLLVEVREFQDYMHGRNHDILNALTLGTSATPILLAAIERQNRTLEQLEEKLDDYPPSPSTGGSP